MKLEGTGSGACCLVAMEKQTDSLGPGTSATPDPALAGRPGGEGGIWWPEGQLMERLERWGGVKDFGEQRHSVSRETELKREG